MSFLTIYPTSETSSKLVPRHEMTINGRYLQLDGCKDEASKYKFQGQSHDLKEFDEVNQFTESQFTYIKTWNRSAIANQRCRVVCSFNPPTSPAQRWVLRYLAPWLDPKHPKPARSGEVRYFMGDQEVPSGEPIGKKIPRSRCFILSKTDDNDMLGDYSLRVLGHLPADLAMLMDFGAGVADDPWQVIPTRWVEAAQSRWADVPQTVLDAIGCDVSRGGQDTTVLALRSGSLIKLRVRPGAEVRNADDVLSLLIGLPESPLYIDVIGVGAAVVDVGQLRGFKVVPVNFSHSSKRRDRSGHFGFRNVRAECHWRLRELLDPAYGATLALPSDDRVLADLTAPKFFVGLNGIQIESKDEIKTRLGWSPDYGDAIALSVANLGMQYVSSF